MVFLIEKAKNSLLKKTTYLRRENKERFLRALNFAEKAHEGQVRMLEILYYSPNRGLSNFCRRSGRYFNFHGWYSPLCCLRSCSLDEIESLFGPQVSLIVDGLTKVEKGRIEKVIYDGESELEFRYRAEKMYHQVLEEYKEFHRIAIVSHGGFISKFLQAFLSLPVNQTFGFSTGDTGIHLIEFKDGKKYKKFLNRRDHLNSQF